MYNVTVYEVRGSVDGKEYHGIMYGALDDDGRQVGTPFKSSKFGKVLGYKALQKKFTASTKKVKKDKLAERTRQEGVEYRQQENQNQNESSGSLIDTSALGAVDIFSVLMEDDHTHEYIDPAFRYGRKKKKKRRRRL